MFIKNEEDIIKNWQGEIDKPLVSIHCVTYNHEKYIKEALDSFLMQKTNFVFEIVVGEDKSLDKTLDIVKEYQTKYPKIIKLITSESNVGMMENYLRVMRACKGKYIAICDGDDYWTDENKLQMQIDLMKKNPECELSFHISSELYGNELKNKIGYHGDENRIFSTPEVIVGDGNFCPSSSLVFTKRSFLYFPESFYQNAPFADYFVQICGSLEGGALYIAKDMSIYRRAHAESWSSRTHTNIESQKRSFEKIVKSINEADKLLDFKFNKEFKTILSKHYYLISVAFLKSGDFQNFSFHIAKANTLYPLKSLKAKVLLLFKDNRFILKLIQKYAT